MNEPNYIELPKDVRLNKGSKLPVTKIPKKIPTPRIARDSLLDETLINREYIPGIPNSIERRQIQFYDQDSQVGFDDFPPPQNNSRLPPDLHNPICVKGNHKPIPLLKPVKKIEDFLEQHFIIGKWIFYLFMKTFGLLFRSLMLILAALPLLLIILAIWAYKYGEPLIRMEKAVEELWKDRTVPAPGWIRF